MHSKWKKLAYICMGLALLSVFVGFGFSRQNTHDIKTYMNPAAEFRQYERDPIEGTYRLCSLKGRVSRSGNMYLLRLPGFLTSGKELVLKFPMVPKSHRSDELEAVYATAVNPADGAGQPVEVQIADGAFDDVPGLHDQMSFRDGLPNRVLLGVYWDLNIHSNRWVKYTVGYQYAADDRFATANTEAALPWMNRRILGVAGYCLRYLYTVPLDLVTSPLQLLATFVAPKWVN